VEQKPSCWGIHWDASNVLCAGGPDATNAPTFSRPRCAHFYTCAAAAAAKRIQQQHQAAGVAWSPPTAPRPPDPPNVGRNYPPPPQQYLQQPPQQYMQPPQQYTQPQQYITQQGWAPPHMAAMPAHVPMNAVIPGAQVGSFLMVPEPINPNVHWGTRLAHSLGRGVAKSIAMVIANFVDHNSVGAYPLPQERPPGQ